MLNYLNNYLKKFAMDILPSVAATIIGAYIVNHYIVTKPGADAPVAAAISAADPKSADVKIDAKPADPKRRDANDLARAAIERLRGTGDNSPPRAPEVARAGETSRIETSRIETPRIETPRVATAPALRPLPPPITVSTPAGESLDQGSQTR